MIAKSIWFHYQLLSEGKTVKEFKITIDPETMLAIIPHRDQYPDWTKLTCHQCPGCPFTPEQMPYCPNATNLIEIIESFRNDISYEEVDVIVDTPERRYQKRSPAQRVVSSIIGILMAASKCTIFDALKPMMRFHLPFSSTEETMYRVFSTYLLGQYLRQNQGLTPDWTIDRLMQDYAKITLVNEAFHKRLCELQICDASLNAVVILSNFANFVPMTKEDTDFVNLKKVYQSYLNQ